MKLTSLTPLCIEMSDAQMVLAEWHATFTDNGMHPMDASNRLLENVQTSGSTVERLMEEPVFRRFLDNQNFPKLRYVEGLLDAGMEVASGLDLPEVLSKYVSS